MALSVVSIAIPFPFGKVEGIDIYPKVGDKISDILDVAIKLSKNPKQKLEEEYGLYLSKSKRWLLNSVDVMDYRVVFENLEPDDRILLMPRRTVELSFRFYAYQLRLQCGYEQSLASVINKMCSILSKYDDYFFTGSDWCISSDIGDFPSDMLVRDLIPYGDLFNVHRSFIRRPKFDGPIFGKCIEDAVSREGPNTVIPSFINAAFDRIESLANREGVFRLSGGQKDIEACARKIDEAKDPQTCIDLVNKLPIDDTTGLLKYYFRNIGDPLIPFHYYKMFEKLMSIKNRKEHKKLMKCLIMTLPQPNYQILNRYLCCLLKVLELSEENKMTISNLSICVALVILKNPDRNADPFSTQKNCQQIIIDIIENYDFYFNTEPDDDKPKMGVCLYDLDNPMYVVAKEGQELHIIDECPEGYEEFMYVETDEQEGYMPRDYIKVKEHKPTCHNLFTDLGTFKFVEEGFLFMEGKGVKGNQECRKKAEDLARIICQRRLIIEGLNKELARLPAGSDPLPIVKKLEALMDLSSIVF